MESPCVQICKLIDSVCVGCFRTTEEIGMWSKYTDKERKEVIKKCMTKESGSGRNRKKLNEAINYAFIFFNKYKN